MATVKIKTKAKRNKIVDQALSRAQAIVIAKPPPRNRVFMLLLVLVVLLLATIVLYNLGFLDWINRNSDGGKSNPPVDSAETSQSPGTTITTPEAGSTTPVSSGIGPFGITVIVISVLLLIGIGILFWYQANDRGFVVRWASKPILIVLFIVVVLTAILIESLAGLTALSNILYFFAMGIVVYYLFILFVRRSERYVAEKQDEISLAALEYVDELSRGTDMSLKAKEFMANVDTATAKKNALQLVLGLEDRADLMLENAGWSLGARSLKAEKFIDDLMLKGMSSDTAKALNEIANEIKNVRETGTAWQQGKNRTINGSVDTAMRKYTTFMENNNGSVKEARLKWNKIKGVVKEHLKEEMQKQQHRAHMPSNGQEKDAE